MDRRDFRDDFRDVLLRLRVEAADPTRANNLTSRVSADLILLTKILQDLKGGWPLRNLYFPVQSTTNFSPC